MWETFEREHERRWGEKENKNVKAEEREIRKERKGKHSQNPARR